MDLSQYLRQVPEPYFHLEGIKISSRHSEMSNWQVRVVLTTKHQQIVLARTDATEARDWSTFSHGRSSKRDESERLSASDTIILDARTYMWHTKTVESSKKLIISRKRPKHSTGTWKHDIDFLDATSKEAFLEEIKDKTQAKLYLCNGLTEAEQKAGQIDGDWNSLGGGAGNMEAQQASTSTSPQGNEGSIKAQPAG